MMKKEIRKLLLRLRHGILHYLSSKSNDGISMINIIT